MQTGSWLVLSSCQGNDAAWQACQSSSWRRHTIEARYQTTEVDLKLHPSNVAQPGMTLLDSHASHIVGFSLPSWGIADQKHEVKMYRIFETPDGR